MKKLGFGGMRFPQTDPKDPKSIDVAHVEMMVDMFLERGYTYFDTAYPYHGECSEETFRKTLVERHDRDRFVLADKLPMFFIKEKEQMPEYFQTQIDRCGVEYFDYYLLHNLGKETYEVAEKIGAFDYLKELKEQGKIRKMGFSFHDEPALLDEILTKHPETEFVQLQLNYMDWESKYIFSRENYEVARKHNKPIIVMEPIKGGMLANLPEQALTHLQAYDPDIDPISLALRFVASLDGVFMVLSGMSNLEQMDQNTMLMGNSFTPITAEETQLLEEIVAIMHDSIAVGCTACQYCVDDCPQNINIPGIFSVYNASIINPDIFSARMYYSRQTYGGGKASDCIECGNCEKHCPQHLTIIQYLKDVAQEFDVPDPRSRI